MASARRSRCADRGCTPRPRVIGGPARRRTTAVGSASSDLGGRAARSAVGWSDTSWLRGPLSPTLGLSQRGWAPGSTSGFSRKTIHSAAGRAVKSASIDMASATAVSVPNWDMGGSGERAKARKPPALMRVAKKMALPDTSSVWRAPSSTVRLLPLLEEVVEEVDLDPFSLVPSTVEAMRMVGHVEAHPAEPHHPERGGGGGRGEPGWRRARGSWSSAAPRRCGRPPRRS